MEKKRERMFSTTIYITDEQDVRLDVEKARTGLKRAEIVRRGVDLVLERMADEAEAAKDRGGR